MHTLERTLEIEIGEKILNEKLTNLGVLEKSGRPAKSKEDKCLNKHAKFTAMLKPNNLDYLKKLKNNGIIDNISSGLML